MLAAVVSMTSNSVPVANATNAIATIANRLPLLSSATEVDLLEQAGFER